MFRSTKEAEEAAAQPQPMVLADPARRAVSEPVPVARVQAAQPPRPVVTSVQPQAAKPVAAAPVPQPKPVAPAASATPSNKPAVSPHAAQLIAGAGVTLKGEMRCDMLRVEGTIEGDVKARRLEISGGGILLGTVEVDEAVVEGRFEGSLTVTGLMVVRKTGRASGKIQYGDIEIERGGAVSGEIAAQVLQVVDAAASDPWGNDVKASKSSVFARP